MGIQQRTGWILVSIVLVVASAVLSGTVKTSSSRGHENNNSVGMEWTSTNVHLTDSQRTNAPSLGQVVVPIQYSPLEMQLMLEYERANDMVAYVPSKSLNGDVLLNVGGSHAMSSAAAQKDPHSVFELSYLYMGITESSTPLPSSSRLVKSTSIELPNHVFAKWNQYSRGKLPGSSWMLETKKGGIYISLGGQGTETQLQQIAASLAPFTHSP